MPNDVQAPNQIARVSNRDLATMSVTEAIEEYAPQFAPALPDNIPVQRFTRTVLTAFNQTPSFGGPTVARSSRLCDVRA